MAVFDAGVRRMERIRAAATAAFIWLDSHETLRVGLNARSRPQHLILQPGMLVYFYEQ